MASLRGKNIGKKLTVDDVRALTDQRNHELLEWKVGTKDSNHVPKSSKIQLKCRTCGYIWSPRLQSYEERQNPVTGGCPGCWARIRADAKYYPESPLLPVEGSRRRSNNETLRKLHSEGPFSHIQSRKNLIQYLKDNPNPHNTMVLGIMEQSRPSIPDMQTHHVIPIHARGCPDPWNTIQVTRQEHYEIHKLRYEVYGETGDLQATYAHADPAQIEVIKAACLCEAIAPLRSNPAIRMPEVFTAFEKGMRWFHQETGVHVSFPPGSEPMAVSDIRRKLCKALPKNNLDRQRLETKNNVDRYFREVIVTVFGDPNDSYFPNRRRAYGFTLENLSSDSP